MLIHLEKLGKSFGEKIVLHDVTASVEREDRIGIVGQNCAGKTTLLKILTGEYQDYEGEFSVTHGVTLGYLEQNAKLDATLDLYGEMRSTFAPVLDAMAQMQVLERKMAAQPDDTELLARHDQLQNIVDAADGYNMDVNIKKVLSGMGFIALHSAHHSKPFRYLLGTSCNLTWRESGDSELLIIMGAMFLL